MTERRGVRVGAAAFAVGLSLAGPQVPGVAAADGGEDNGVPAVHSADRASARAARVPGADRGAAPPSARTPVAPPARSRSVSAASAGGEAVAPGRASTRASGPPVRAAAKERDRQSPTAPRPAAYDVTAAVATPGPAAAGVLAPEVSRDGETPALTRGTRRAPAATALVTGSTGIGTADVAERGIAGAPSLRQALNAAVVRFFDGISSLLSGLPAGPVTDLLSGALLLIRRTLFDQKPTVSSTGAVNSALQTQGAITATDPEGDPVRIEVADLPEFGAVELAADGTYRYTPGPGYTGSDDFTVRVTDANGGFNVLYPFSDLATLHTVDIGAPAPGTMLTVNLRAAFLQDVTGTETGQPGTGTRNGSYVYLYQPQPAEGAPNWTKVVDEGAITSAVAAPDAANPDYRVDVALNAKGQSINGGAIYLIVQSENPEPCQTGQKTTCHTDLTTVSDWTEAFVQQKVQDYNYGYTAFEYALLKQAGDQGDITYIPGFGPHIAVEVCRTSGSCDTRGLALNSTDFVAGLLKAGVSQEAVFTYPEAPTGLPFSPLDGKPSIVISPSNGTFGANYYPESNWNDYLTKTIDALPPGAMTFSGTTAGARDAAGVWHNGQYYSYGVQSVTDHSGTSYYLFSPDANSQTRGYMLIKQSDVGKNLYAPGQGSALATLYQSVTVSNGVITALGDTYDIPGRTPPGGTEPGPGQFNVSANNQWGNALTQYFTGFTAGNWGTVAEQANPVNRGGPDATNLAGTVDLNTNLNWDPAYAFDENRVPGTAPAYQHNDQYSFFFYQNANTYASAFSDNLAQKLNPGPQISLATGPGVNENVTQIDLYVFGADEPVGPDGDGFYKKPVSTNFLAAPTTGDYVIPTAPGSTLTLQVQGFNLGSKVVDDATVRLGIYGGAGADKQATFDYVTLPTHGGVYQNYTVGGTPGAWTATAAGVNSAGFIQINGLPMPTTVAKDDVYWYQFVVADNAGGDQRVFNIYATSDGTTPGEVTPFNPGAGVGSANDPSAAIDNNAGLNVVTGQITVNLQPDASLPAALLTNGWNPFTANNPQSPQPPGGDLTISVLAAPVVGLIGSGGEFQAVPHQYGTGVSVTEGYPKILNQAATAAQGKNVYFDNPLPVANLTGASTVAFGWTGTNSYAGEPDPAGTSYAPTLPVFETSAPYNLTQAGQVGQYTNKILPGNTAEVTVMQGTTVVATATGVADLDGQWQTGSITLTPGTYTATMTELAPDGSPVVDYLGRPSPGSATVTINVS